MVRRQRGRPRWGVERAPPELATLRTVLRSLLLTSVVASSLVGCTCSSNKVSIGGGGGGASGGTGSTAGGSGGGSSAGTGGSGAGTGGSGTGGGVASRVVISPRDVLVNLVTGQPPPTVQFSALADGNPVVPAWSVTPGQVGAIDATGLFTASPLGGVATITARVGAATDSTTVTVKLTLTQNGGTAMDAGVGGFGGVGGEGEGRPVDPATVTVLGGAPTADTAVLLYPYDATVWPRGMLPPLLQWTAPRSYDAVSIQLTCPVFSFTGTFAKTATPFIHHPVPRGAWERATELCAGQQLSLRVVFASGGQAYGPLTQTWRIASGSLKGVVYYNSYGTRLAKNYSGALGPDPLFGGATLSIRGGSTDPALVAGGNGTEANCRVCHVVSANGSALLTQHGDAYTRTSHYALRSGNAETVMAPADGRFAWGAISPDGTRLFSNVGPIAGSASGASGLFEVPSGTTVATTGLPAGLGAATPAFSADGRSVAFNWYGGSGSDQRSLASLRFTPPGTFSDLTTLYTPPAGRTAVFPSFLPTGAGVVFQVETVSNGRFGETRATCDSSGPCSDVGTRGELWWVDVATKQARRLDRLNGLGLVPTGANSHDDDSTLNYEPTVGPIASGGYAWVIFTSRRLYGNVATINPWWSDPRFHDLSSTPTTKKLWVAAVDLNATPGTDPSHPAFYLPAQELLAGNSRGYWSADPCRSDLESCSSGDECCGGYCSGPPGAMTCNSTRETDGGTGCAAGLEGCTDGGMRCSQEFERCTTVADCCQAASVCASGRCAGIN